MFVTMLYAEGAYLAFLVLGKWCWIWIYLRSFVLVVRFEVVVLGFPAATTRMVEARTRNSLFHHRLQFIEMLFIDVARRATVFLADRRRHASNFAANAKRAHYSRRGKGDVRTADVASGKKKVPCISGV